MAWFESHLGGSASSSGHDYSTDEQIIGTWIDGSTLYEKTYPFTAPANNTTTNLINISSLSVNDIIYLDGYINYYANRAGSITYKNDGFKMWIRFKDNPSAGGNDTIVMQVTNSSYYSQQGALVIRYTKSST